MLNRGILVVIPLELFENMLMLLVTLLIAGVFVAVFAFVRVFVVVLVVLSVLVVFGIFLVDGVCLDGAGR